MKHSTKPAGDAPEAPDSGPLEPRAAIDRRLRAVRLRVRTNRLLRVLFSDLLVALAVFLAFVIADRLLAIGLDPLLVFACLTAAALVVGLARGLFFGRLSEFGAAVLVDDRLSLRERISSAVYLGKSADGAAAEGWRDLIEADGARSIEKVDVERAFPVNLPRTAIWGLVLLVVTVLLPIAVEQQDLLGWQSRRVADAALEREVEQEVEDLVQRGTFQELEQFAEKTEDPAMKELLEALKQLEKKGEKPDDGKPADPEKSRGDAAKQEALVKLNRVEDLIKKRAAQGDFDQLKGFLDKMKALRLNRADVTRALQEALKSGDLAKASEALSKLQDELKKLSEQKKAGQQLTPEQLERLQKLKDELGALGRQSSMLSKLDSGLQGMDMKNLSMSDLSQMLQNLEQSSLDLASLQQLMQQMSTLEQSLQALKLAKQGMGKWHNCPNCGKLRKDTQPGGT